MAPLTLGWLHIIALLGAIQGVFLAGVLATKRTNRTANRLLAVTIAAFSIHLASTVYYATGFERVAPHFFGVAHPLPFLYGPLLYLYAVTAADRSRRLTRRDLLHFVPFIAVVITGLPIYLMSGAEKIALYQQIKLGDVPFIITVTVPLKLVSGIVYAGATLLFLRRHRDQVKESYSTTDRVNLRWLMWLGAGAAIIWMMAIVIQTLEATGIATIQPGDDLISVAMALMVYGIGYMGLRQPEVFRYETAEHRVPVELLRAEPPPPEPEAPRYERSGLGDREAERLKSSLLAVMDKEQPWRQSELTLAELADMLSTTPHKLSEVINGQLDQTFYDFVNGYRVREVQRRIAAGEAKRLTILSLALDAGFASKSTFNVVFKKHTSQTPSDYRQTVGA